MISAQFDYIEILNPTQYKMKHLTIPLMICIAILFSPSCQQAKKVSDHMDTTEKSMAEKTTTKSSTSVSASSVPGWHTFNKTGLDPSWEMGEDGVLSFDKSRGEGGDIVTDKEYENFELSLEWKISDCGNSGIFWGIVESTDYRWPWQTGPEMQILDNKCHPDAKIKTHRAGDLYDMIETSVVNVKPAGEWNSIKIKSDRGNMSFFQNGAEVVTFTMHNESWDAMKAKSKFKDMESFGTARKGRIGLQDHNDKVWFRNISITEL